LQCAGAVTPLSRQSPLSLREGSRSARALAPRGGRLRCFYIESAPNSGVGAICIADAGGSVSLPCRESALVVVPVAAYAVIVAVAAVRELGVVVVHPRLTAWASSPVGLVKTGYQFSNCRASNPRGIVCEASMR